ncbi:MAG: hypothetical protein HY402_04175 [Elusimicrobia bacterium]|nr:hypothetical protein [Elusimicrobiota bacterium]
MVQETGTSLIVGFQIGYSRLWKPRHQAGPQRRVEPALPDRSRVPQAFFQ